MTNILLVMTDQQRADLRRGEGYPLDTMPFLDSFTRNDEGIPGADDLIFAVRKSMPWKNSMLNEENGRQAILFS